LCFSICNIPTLRIVKEHNYLFMKQLLFLVAAIGLSLFSCKKANSVDSIPPSLDGKWRMITVKENSSGLTTGKPALIQGDVDITFTSVSPTTGVFTGNTPTNSIVQNDYSIGANQSLSIPNLNMTKIMETTWGNEFVQNIRNSQEYSLDGGGRLNIKTINKTLSFKKL
jgi:hypothetical protein